MTSRPRRRTLAIVVFTPVLCGVLVAALVGAAWLALGSPAPARAAVWMQVVKTGEARDTGAPDQPFFVLAVGTGARSDNPGESQEDPGLADAVHVIGVNPALGAGTIINIPRDTEGPGGSKINSYILSSGTENLRSAANAVSSIVGVQLPMVVRVNFPHFTELVDGIGGIDINIPTAMNDPFSGSNFAAGPAHLNGQQALAFSRDRMTFPNGDLTRTSNQGLVILSALATLRARNPSAGDTVRLVALVGRHVKLDGVGISELFHMGQLSLTIDPANMRNVTLPVANAGGSNLAPTAAAREMLADFADDAVLQTH